jgi:hypothetical protein
VMVRGKALKEAEPEISVLLNQKYAEKIQVCTYCYLCKYLANALDQSDVCCSKLCHSVGPLRCFVHCSSGHFLIKFF